MKIRRIFAHKVELPLNEGSYKWSGGKSVTVFDSTIVGVETECGLVGYGEVCPLGPFYLPAYAEGVRAGLRELGPHLIGWDPREITKLNHRMDAALKGIPTSSQASILPAGTCWEKPVACPSVRCWVAVTETVSGCIAPSHRNPRMKWQKRSRAIALPATPASS